MTRQIDYFEYVQNKENTLYTKVFKGPAVFHEFGVDYEEFESGPGNYSTAIIELSDGTVKQVPVDFIVFTDAK